MVNHPTLQSGSATSFNVRDSKATP